jgi:nitroreductase
MELYETIYSGRAVRAYSADPVDDETLRKLIGAATQAPSAMNEQPWSFTVVRDRSLLAQISNRSKAHLLLAEVRQHHLREVLSHSDFDIFYQAPALIVISSTVKDEWALVNCALAAENLMLAAQAEGLGTCWIGLAQSWLDTPDGKAAMGVPEAYRSVAPIIVGHPRNTPVPVTRKVPNISWIGP